MSEHFDRLQALPNGFFEIETANIRSLFTNPTLVNLEGNDPNHLFVSILLHGNEYTGLKVMQRVLAEHRAGLPRSILLFIGNVRAAEANLRFLPDQVDYNRCWPGSVLEPGPTAQMMRHVVEIAHTVRVPPCARAFAVAHTELVDSNDAVVVVHPPQEAHPRVPPGRVAVDTEQGGCVRVAIRHTGVEDVPAVMATLVAGDVDEA